MESIQGFDKEKIGQFIWLPAATPARRNIHIIVVLETRSKKQVCTKGQSNRFRNGREKGVQTDR